MIHFQDSQTTPPMSRERDEGGKREEREDERERERARGGKGGCKTQIIVFMPLL